MKNYWKRTFAGLLLALLIGCVGQQSAPHYDLQVNAQKIAVDQTIAPDSLLAAEIQPYRAELEKTMGVIIGEAAIDLRKGKPERELNNFIADLMLERGMKESAQPVHMALTNLGGLRVEIPKGPVTLGKAYEVMPFENELVIVTLSGEQLLRLAQQIVEVGGEPVAGVKIVAQNKKLQKLLVQGKPVDPQGEYRVVTTDYLSEKGRRRLNVLSEGKREFIGITLRQAIIDHFKALQAAGKAATAKIDGRVQLR